MDNVTIETSDKNLIVPQNYNDNKNKNFKNSIFSSLGEDFNMEWLTPSEREHIMKLEEITDSYLQLGNYLVKICKRLITKFNNDDIPVQNIRKQVIKVLINAFETILNSNKALDQNPTIFRKWGQALMIITQTFDLPLFETIIDTFKKAISMDKLDYKSRYKLAYTLAKYASYMHTDLNCDFTVIDQLFKDSEFYFLQSISIKNDSYETHLLWGDALYEKLVVTRNFEKLNDIFNLVTLKYFAAYTIKPHDSQTLECWSKSLDFLIKYYLPYYWDTFYDVFKSSFKQFLAVIRDLMLHGRYTDFSDPLQYLTKYLIDSPFSFITDSSIELLNELKKKCVNEQLLKELERISEYIEIKKEEKNKEFKKLKEKTFVTLQSLPPDAFKIWKNSGLNVNDIYLYYDVFMNSLLFSVGKETRNHEIFNCHRRKSDSIKSMNKQLEDIEKEIIYENPFENFSVISKLDSGAFGVIYVGEEKQNRRVALKEIKATKGSKRYINALHEIYSMKKLKGPNIVEYYLIYYYKDCIYIQMEFYQGGSLGNLTRQLFLEEKEIAFLAYQICMGLYQIHINDMAHLDLKSENIFLSVDGDVKIGDFSLAREVNNNEDTLTSMVGTNHWIAPEIIQNKKYGQKADIWSFGCVCLELIQGKSPNNKLTTINSLFRTGTKGIPKFNWPSKGKWTREFKNFIAEILHPDPARRPSSREILQHPYFLKKDCDLKDLKFKIKQASVGTSLKLSGIY